MNILESSKSSPIWPFRASSALSAMRPARTLSEIRASFPSRLSRRRSNPYAMGGRRPRCAALEKFDLWPGNRSAPLAARFEPVHHRRALHADPGCSSSVLRAPSWPTSGWLAATQWRWANVGSFLRRHGIRPGRKLQTRPGRHGPSRGSGIQTRAASAPASQAKSNGLEPIAENIMTTTTTTTRFLVMARTPSQDTRAGTQHHQLRVRSAEHSRSPLQGPRRFATNGINMVKLESLHGRWLVHGDSVLHRHRGHPDDHGVRPGRWTSYASSAPTTKLLGVYEAHPHRYRYG